MIYRNREEVGQDPAGKLGCFKNNKFSESGAPCGEVVFAKRTATMIKEEHYNIHRTTPKNEQVALVGQTDQEFPDHWTRYRPVRRSPRL